MGLAIGIDASALRPGGVTPGQPVFPGQRRGDSTAAATGAPTSNSSDATTQQSPPLTGLGHPLLSPESARQAQEHGASTNPNGPKAPDGSDLTPAQQEEVAKLKQVDRAVKAHEQAHASVGGRLAGAPSYTYEQGPDGQRYAVAGEVPISTGASSDPATTIRNAEQVIAAALAPADPSGQDRAVAASAQQLKAQAEAELAKKQQERLAKNGLGQPDGQSANEQTGTGATGASDQVGTGRVHAAAGVAAYRQAGANAEGASALSLTV